MLYREYISIAPPDSLRKPCIKGTRIAVYDVLGWLADDMSIAEILQDFPQLKKEQILACLAYAANKEKQLQ